MKTGISTACFFCREYNENAVKEIAKLGICDIEIFFSAQMEYQRSFTDELKRICSGEGIRVCAVHAMCTQFEPQLFSAHKRQADEALVVFDKVCDAAANLGAGIYVFHGPMNIKRARTLHINYQYAGEKTAFLAERCKKSSVKLAYENVHWCWYHKPGFAQKLLKNADTDNLYFTLDIKQAAQSGYEIADYIDDMGKKLAHIHVCDYTKDANNKINPCLAFDGEMDWQGLKKKLSDFEGLMMLEVYPKDYQTYHELYENYLKVKNFFE
ncbi:MAG: sugar phosphate isomerase/epimerase [Christensenellaceae bacterium]